MSNVALRELWIDGGTGTSRCDIRVEQLADLDGFMVHGEGFTYRNHRRSAYSIGTAHFATKDQAMTYAESVYRECVEELGFSPSADGATWK